MINRCVQPKIVASSFAKAIAYYKTPKYRSILGCLNILWCSVLFSIVPASAHDSAAKSFDRLMMAIEKVQVDDVEALSSSLAFTPSQQAKALIKATQPTTPQLLEILLSKGFDPNSIDPEAMNATAIMNAAYANNIDAMEALITAGAKLDTPDVNGDPAINWAAFGGKLEAVRWLVERGARLDLVGHGNALQIAKRRGHQPVVSLLCKTLKCNPTLSQSVILLIEQVDRNDVNSVKESFKSGIPVTSLDETGRPILHRAARQGHLEMVALFLELGAPIDLQDDIGFTPLMEAVRDSQFSMVKLLLARNANINHSAKASALKLTPSHLAAISGNELTIDFLHQKGANLNAQDSAGNNPMLWAIFEGQVNAAKKILSLGADATLKNQQGLYAAQYLFER